MVRGSKDMGIAVELLQLAKQIAGNLPTVCYNQLGKVGFNSLVQVLEWNLHRKGAVAWRWASERRLDSALKRPANRGCVALGVRTKT